MKRVFNSLKGRITVGMLLIGILPVILLHFIVINSYEYNLIEQRTIDIHQRCNRICARLGSNENIYDSLKPELVDILNWYSAAYGGRILVVDDMYRIVFDSYNADLGKKCISDAVFRAVEGTEYSEYQSDTEYISEVLPVYYTEEEKDQAIGVLIFSSTTSWINSSLQKVEEAMLLIEAVLLVIVILISLYYGYVVTRPVNSVAYEVDRLNAGNTDVDLSAISSYTEINEILKSSEQVVQRFQDLERSQEEFVSNVSHELRTPITSVRVLADSLIGQENIEEEVYQDFLKDISFEVERESRIIDDLLTMVRLGKSSDNLNISTVNINEFILGILKLIRPIAETRGIELIFESFRQVSADVDEIKLGQAISNLIDNAVKYNRENGFVRVSLDADQEYFYIRISDNGIGIPEEALPHIFDRFYRVDKARSRETGGTGLGLFITRSIILFHYGVIKAESTDGEGTTFTIRIPLRHVAQGGV